MNLSGKWKLKAINLESCYTQESEEVSFGLFDQSWQQVDSRKLFIFSIDWFQNH